MFGSLHASTHIIVVLSLVSRQNFRTFSKFFLRSPTFSCSLGYFFPPPVFSQLPPLFGYCPPFSGFFVIFSLAQSFSACVSIFCHFPPSYDNSCHLPPSLGSVITLHLIPSFCVLGAIPCLSCSSGRCCFYPFCASGNCLVIAGMFHAPVCFARTVQLFAAVLVS